MSSASPKMHIVLWDLYVHYSCHSSLPLFPILSWISLVHACFFKIHFHMYYYYHHHHHCYYYFCTTVFQVVSSLQVSSPEPSVYFSFSPICATCPAFLIFLDLITWIIFGDYHEAESYFLSLRPDVFLITLLLWLP